MRSLEISKDFTLEDIRKIRDYAYYRRLEIGAAYEKETRQDYLKGLAILNRLKAERLK
ncbi:MAG: hypothetical protein LBP30_04390 [Clostridiales Family XIII bacterium]|jgi:hypothetical protein|nr:hypothetical protein [Clostridiales Family XIII bacterium]